MVVGSQDKKTRHPTNSVRQTQTHAGLLQQGDYAFVAPSIGRQKITTELRNDTEINGKTISSFLFSVFLPFPSKDVSVYYMPKIEDG